MAKPLLHRTGPRPLHTKTGQIHYIILLYLDTYQEKKVKRMLKFIRYKEPTIAVINTLGDWDYKIDIGVASIRQLEQFQLALTNQHANIIKDYDILRIAAMPKYSFYP